MRIFALFLSVISCLWGREEGYIDVVIPAIKKDQELLEKCIQSALEYVDGVRRVIVISPEKLTANAEWFPENVFPFSIEDVGAYLEESFIEKSASRKGWYFQQLLKLYAFFVIPDIADYILLLDADTIFLHEFSFFDPHGRALFYVRPFGDIPLSYLRHMKRMHPSLNEERPKVNPVVNFMLFEREKVEKFFQLIELYHNKPFWRVFLDQVERVGYKNMPHHIGASEFVLYYFFCKTFYQDSIDERSILMEPFGKSLENLAELKEKGVDVFSCPHFRRKHD